VTKKFGFELEGFFVNKETGVPDIPPKNYPKDGFPGLVEIRTQGANSLAGGLGEILCSMKLWDNVDFQLPSYKFSAKQISELRKKYSFVKSRVDVQSIYNKAPRLSGGRSLSSFQISISDLNFKNEPQLFDFVPIIRRLDELFKVDIQQAGRQLGVYCIKGPRIEYRSLPSFVFEKYGVAELFKMIREATESDAC
jgi:hypothetical protein